MKKLALIGATMLLGTNLIAKDLTPKEILLEYVKIVEHDCPIRIKTGYHMKSDVAKMKALMYKADNDDAEVRLGFLCGKIAEYKLYNERTRENNAKYNAGDELYDDSKKLTLYDFRYLEADKSYHYFYRYFAEQYKDNYDKFDLNFHKVKGKWYIQ